MARASKSLETNSEKETFEAGINFSDQILSGDVVVLTGPLGAGKTVFIKGLAAGLDVEREIVKSPSYTLVNEYDGRIKMYHFDLYRIDDISELYHIGWDDYLLRDGIVVVEWGEKAGTLLPGARIDISIDIMYEDKRKIKITYPDA